MLRSAPLRRLGASQALSGTAEWLLTFAMLAIVLSRSKALVGLVLSLRILPSLVAAPLAGTIGDRFDRRRVMVVCDLARAMLALALPFTHSIPVLLAVLAAVEVLQLTSVAARDSALPGMAGESLALANSGIMGLSYAAAPVAGGLFALSGKLAPGRTGAFVMAGVIYVISAGLLTRIPLLSGRSAEAVAKGRRVGLWRELGAGMLFLVRHPLLRSLAPGAITGCLAGGVVMALGVSYVHETLGAGSAGFGGLMALFAVGVGAGVSLLHAARRRMRVESIFRNGLVLMGGALLLMAGLPHLALGLGVAAFFGAGFAVVLVGGTTLVQEQIHEAHRAKALAALSTAGRGTLVSSAIAAGPLAGLVGHGHAGFGGLRLVYDGNQVAMLVAGALLLLAGLVVSRRQLVPARNP
ncbi:MAG: MFS transporter [Actinomycetota bacterium]